MTFTVYRTTNSVNGKFYIGVHKTDDPLDSYLGSGKLIKRAIAKYGEQCFSKEILLTTLVAEDAFAMEFELVKTHRSNPLCYNLRNGGSGGFDFINRTGLNGNSFKTKDSIRRGVEKFRARFSNPDVVREVKEHMARIRPFRDPEKSRKHLEKIHNLRRGARHSEASKRAMSAAHKGNKARLGKVWMNKNGIVLVADVSKVPEMLSNGWERGRKSSSERKYRTNPEKHVPLHLRAPKGTSWCAGHKDFLPVDQFHKDKLRLSGYKDSCIDCRKLKRGTKNPKVRRSINLHPQF